MNALVRGELVKLRTTRTAVAFGGAAVILVLFSVLIQTLAGDPNSVNDQRNALNFGGTLSVPLLLFGIVGATGEFRHKTLAPAVLVAPDRVRLTLARMIAYGMTAFIVGLAMCVVAFAVGLPLLAGSPGPSPHFADYLQVGAGGVLSVTLSAMVGVGVGVLVANQVASVVGALVWLFIVEPLVGLLDDKAVRFTFNQSTLALGGVKDPDLLAFLPALGMVAAWAAVFVLAGSLVDRQRDVA